MINFYFKCSLFNHGILYLELTSLNYLLATSHHTNTQPLKRPADKSAQTRDLRERHVTNTQELEKLQLKDAFEVLVEKYVTDKTPLHVETGRVSNTRSIFENHQI